MQGLSKKEVLLRQQRFGFNEIKKNKENYFIKFLKKFWAPIPWMIEIALIFSAILHDWINFVIILILLFVNIIVDYIQDTKATHALSKLEETLASQAIVLRENKFIQILARELVPGDIIKLKIGDIIPADVELLSEGYLLIDQSTLTGESLPTSKKNGDVVYSGSSIKQGDMLAKVTATGFNTFMGKSAQLITEAEDDNETHFQKAVLHIGNFLILISLILAVLILIAAFIRHDSIIETIRFIIVLLIASIPVALPAVLSVTMAIGALEIAKKKAIIKNLTAIEEMAGTDVLCSDKTGTLTQNKLTIKNPITYSKYTEDDLFTCAILASTQENNDPIEAPIYKYAKINFLAKDVKKYKLLSFIPFDSLLKKTEAKYSLNSKFIKVYKGAPQVIAQLSNNSEIKNKLLSDVTKLANRGYRSLAVAYSIESDTEVDLVGLIPLLDPPRTDSVTVIKKIRQLGIDVKMLTGDNQEIAKEIANLLNIGSNILPISEMRTNDKFNEHIILTKIIAKGLYHKLNKTITPEELEIFSTQIAQEVKKTLKNIDVSTNYIKQHESDIIELIERADGFSEVLPEDKFFIIDKLQKNNHFVAMTGDGVNDAPALKKADIGIAVSGATDAARAASDMVLLSPGLSVIESAIKMSRETFERMKGYATFRIAETIRIMLFMALSIIVFNFYPITAVMIIILALLNDIPVMMIAYDNAPANNNPVHWDMREVLTISFVLGIAGVISSFLIFYYLKIHSYSTIFIQAILFLKLDVAGHSTLYLTRTGKKHFWTKPFPSFKFFIPAFTTRVLGTFIAVYGIFMEPIGWKMAGIIWIYALLWWIFNDYLKVWTYKLIEKTSKTKMHYKSIKTSSAI